MASDSSEQTEPGIEDTGLYLMYDGPKAYWTFDYSDMDLNQIDGAIEAWQALRRYTEGQISGAELG